MPAQVSAGGGEEGAVVRVEWDPPADDGGAPVEGYVLEMDDGQPASQTPSLGTTVHFGANSWSWLQMSTSPPSRHFSRFRASCYDRDGAAVARAHGLLHSMRMSAVRMSAVRTHVWRTGFCSAR